MTAAEAITQVSGSADQISCGGEIGEAPVDGRGIRQAGLGALGETGEARPDARPAQRVRKLMARIQRGRLRTHRPRPWYRPA